MDNILEILNAIVREAAAPQTAAVAIAVIGLNIHFGFTGLLNFGQAGFMLLGAYGFAISVTKDVPFPAAVLIGLGCALLFALVLGIPTLKLRGDYLAIVTISAAEIVRFVGRLSLLEDFTGGSEGIQGRTYQPAFADLSFFGQGQFTLLPFNHTDFGSSRPVQILALVVFLACVAGLVVLVRKVKVAQDPAEPETLSRSNATKLAIAGLVVVALLAVFFALPLTYARSGINGWWLRAIAWSLVGVSAGIVYMLVRSPWGRLLRGIREDEDAMRSLGKNVFAIKMQALVIGGLFGALGGMLYVLPSTVQPDAFGRSLTFFAYTALLLGGAATIFGPVLGTILFYSARILIREVAGTYVPGLNTTEAQQVSFVIVGVALMLLVIFRPQGILGNKRELRFNV